MLRLRSLEHALAYAHAHAPATNHKVATFA